MDKISSIIGCLLIIGCSQNYNLQKDNISKIHFNYESFIYIDFSTGIVELDYYKKKYNDTITFNKNEKDIIYNFPNVQIDKDKNYYFDENYSSNSVNDEIIVYKKDKTITKLIINFNYDIDEISTFNKDYEIVKYRDNIKKMLNNNEDFQEVKDTLNKYIKQKGYIF